ncbi:hypothetical protein BJY04DRAFT_81007 [Aspergillus karnatakaensis]|uniref:uncharacterized protein n=1 Tax=Aspergillus karnatakaensis TaxID=1810916 RepID=UPI003CCD4739
MCGIARPSSGHRIAIMFPPPPAEPTGTSHQSYSLFFQESESKTKAVFRIKDINTVDAFRAFQGIDLRIEQHGDLSIGGSSKLKDPLFKFQLQPTFPKGSEEVEFSLPEKLDLGVSEQGIVGRQVTVVGRGATGEVVQMGNGIVGYD